MNTTSARGKLYSPKSGDFLRKLAAERQVPPAGRTAREATTISRIEDVLGNHPVFDLESDRHVSQTEVSEAISWLLGQPKVEDGPVAPLPALRPTVPTAVVPGVYETPDGEIFVVKQTQDRRRTYAKRAVVINADRLTDADTVVNIEFEYDRGAIFRLRPEDRMGLERARELSLRYGKCIDCGHKLKAAKSVALGVGPVCAKKYDR
jgi:hypothetical protein